MCKPCFVSDVWPVLQGQSNKHLISQVILMFYTSYRFSSRVPSFHRVELCCHDHMNVNAYCGLLKEISVSYNEHELTGIDRVHILFS